MDPTWGWFAAGVIGGVIVTVYLMDDRQKRTQQPLQRLWDRRPYHTLRDEVVQERGLGLFLGQDFDGVWRMDVDPFGSDLVTCPKRMNKSSPWPTFDGANAHSDYRGRELDLAYWMWVRDFHHEALRLIGAPITTDRVGKGRSQE